MTGKGHLCMVFCEIDCGRYFHVVPIQHHTEYVGVEVGKEPVDELQHWDIWTAGEPKLPGQAVSLVHWDQEGQLESLVYIL